MMPNRLLPAARALVNKNQSQDIRNAQAIKREMYSELEQNNIKFPSNSAADTVRMLNNPEAALWRDSNPYNLYNNHGIEAWHPFFDVRLIKLRLSLPANYFYRNGEFKVLLRKAMKNILPEQIRTRQDKADFGAIVKTQLSECKIENNSINETFQEIITPELWNSRKEIHAKRGFDDHEEFLEWKLLNMYSWMNTHS